MKDIDKNLYYFKKHVPAFVEGTRAEYQRLNYLDDIYNIGIVQRWKKVFN